MNTIWSEYIQNTGTLHTSRSLRFSDIFRDSYTGIFGLSGGMRILEVGCGTGALCSSLMRWYPSARVTGIDRDSRFIAFARENSRGAEFVEGDATALPFADASFDVTVSNTVSEHIEPSAFFGEQRRVLRENGICIVLSARKGINIPAPCIKAETEFEKDIWKRTGSLFEENLRRFGVCAYPQNEAELPRNMERYGFRNVHGIPDRKPDPGRPLL